MENDKLEYKGYLIQPLGTWPGFRIRAKGSGTIPDFLKGEYTRVEFAKKQIDASLSALKGKRRKTNAKELSSSTD